MGRIVFQELHGGALMLSIMTESNTARETGSSWGEDRQLEAGSWGEDRQLEAGSWGRCIRRLAQVGLSPVSLLLGKFSRSLPRESTSSYLQETWAIQPLIC